MASLRPLNKALSQHAHKYLNETPEKLAENLEIFRSWVLDQVNLRTPTDDQFLIIFLRSSAHNVDEAKERFITFWRTRRQYPEIFKFRDPTSPRARQIMNFGSFIPLPYTNGDDGPRYILIRPAAFDTKQFSINDMCKYHMLIADILLMDDDNYLVAGYIGILDLQNVNQNHFLQYDLGIIKKMTTISSENSPYRLNSFHYINTPSGFGTMLNMFKMFISEEKKKQLFVHGQNLESLYEYIPQKFLPLEYGGEAGAIDNLMNDLLRRLINYRDYIIKFEKYGIKD